MTVRLRFGAVFAAIASAALSGTAHAALSVQAHAMSNVTCVHNVCTATAPGATMSYKRLETMLASADVTLVASNGANDIEVAAPLTWASSHRLTLDAPHSITVTRPVNVTGTGALTITTNDGGSGGMFSVSHGSIHFWDLSSSLVINGETYKLVGNIVTLVSNITTHPTANYALAANYDAAADGVYTRPPITSVFQGNFEGLGNTIGRFAIRGKVLGDAALFEMINGHTTVADLHLTHVRMIGHAYARMGAIAAANIGVIANVSVQGSLAGGGVTYTGGIVGYNEGTVRDAHADVQITTLDEGNAGGIAGYNRGTIERASATGSVGADNSAFAGGIVGTDSSIIRQSFSSATVTVQAGLSKQPEASAGGIVGQISGAGSTVTDCYSTGSVTSGIDANAGGLAGISSSGAIGTSYATGAVSVGSGGFAGGVLGDDFVSGTYTSVYWDTDTTGISNMSQGAGNIANDPGLTGLNDAALKSSLPSGFDSGVWGQSGSINNGLPYLLANPPPS